MLVRHEYHPEAFAELSAAAEWYEAELPNLGMSFQDRKRRTDEIYFFTSFRK